jgi:tetratricopeptide (TPR) repeat protein
MNLKILLVLVFLISSSQLALSQNVTEEEAVKKVIRFEAESYMKDDSVAWKDQFVQDDKTSMVFIGFGFAQNHVGWDNFARMMIQWIKDFPSQYTDLQQSNHIINISNDLAWLAFDQLLSTPGVDSISARGSREFRTLIRDNDRWKISSLITIDTASYISTEPQYMEDHFNFLGYRYLEDDMMDEALEVFKLNVKLYPKAWNPYDSLGEAYALMGDKDLAIENYKKSIELNPDNEHGKEMLRKLEEE